MKYGFQQVRKIWKYILLGIVFLVADLFFSAWFILGWRPIFIQRALQMGVFETSPMPLDNDSTKHTWSQAGYIKKIGVGYIEISTTSGLKKINFTSNTLFFVGQIRPIDPEKIVKSSRVPDFSINDYVIITYIQSDSQTFPYAILVEQ